MKEGGRAMEGNGERDREVEKGRQEDVERTGQPEQARKRLRKRPSASGRRDHDKDIETH